MKQVMASGPVKLNEQFKLNDDQAHHIFDVLRTTPNETIRLVWDNEVFLAHPDGKPMVYVFGKEEVEPRLVDITLCASLIKQDHFEWMLQKAAELGVNRIIPFVSKNSVVRLDSPEKEQKKLKRWSKILEQAVNQSNRVDYVELEPVQNLKGLKDFKSDCNIVAYENEAGRHIADELSSSPDSVTVVIGPEGGFTPDEIEELQEMGFVSCSLGNNILRAETAALYVLSVIEYQTHCPGKDIS